MEHYTGNYDYKPLKKGVRALYKPDGTFPPPNLPPDALCLTYSIAKYRMETTGELRILGLLPGAFGDPLRCQLRVVAIEDGPVYDALSYMWGDSSPEGHKGSIMLDGKAFTVTESLENALRHVRLRDSVRYLWADAVCINQRDIQERGNQVHLMKELYSRSRTVRVWIDVDLPPEHPVVRELFTLQLQGAVDQLGDDPEFWKPLLPLLQNPYWDRLWIQQELVFAPRLVFHCRGVAIPGNCLMALQFQIFRKPIRREGPFDFDDPWHQFRPLVSTTKAPSRNLACWRKMVKSKVPVDPHTLQPDLSLLKPEAEWQLDPKKWGPWLSTSPIYLLGMLRLSQTLNVTDPKDRVTAVLNLVTDYNDDGWEAEYEQSFAERYSRVAKLLLFKCNSLQILTMARICTITDPTVRGLPSWAPNWNSPGNAEYFLSPFCAAGELPMYETPFQETDDILHARGFRYGKVDRTLSTTNNAFTPLSVLSKLFISATKFTKCHKSEIVKLASTLTGPAIAELHLGGSYFSETEAVFYTGILLSYAFVTPGLRIVDLLPYTTKLYDESQKDLTVALQGLQGIQNLRPLCLRWLNLENASAAVPKSLDQTERFGYFVRLVHKTLSAGNLASLSRHSSLAITEGKALVQPDDEIWILFGCATPMVLRRTDSHFLVVSPAYIFDTMNGETMEGVTSPEDKIGGWSRILREGRLTPVPGSSNASGRFTWTVKGGLSPASKLSYVSGKWKWTVEVIRLR
jgi:hypothetical protein